MHFSGVFSDVAVVLPSPGGYRSPELKHVHSIPDSKFLQSSVTSKTFVSSLVRKMAFVPHKQRGRSFTVRASGDTGGDLVPIAPLQLDSPVGQVLGEMLKSHPHLLPAAIDQQLEFLENERDSKSGDNSVPSQDPLYKRIAEVKENERRKTLEEIIYCLVVKRFIDNNIVLIPKIDPTSGPTGKIDFWTNQEQRLESVFSPEAFEMIISHIALVLGERAMRPIDSIIQMSKIKLGKLYAASIMYGYFLKRVDERYQLEKSMNTLPEGFDANRARFEEPVSEKGLWDPESLIRIYPDDPEGGGPMDSDYEDKSYALKSYVMYLDAETLQRYATIRSKEAISLIEKQTQALFGRPDIKVAEDGSLDTSNDESVSLTFSGLTLLVLEAVAFGSFLWDAEGYVESKYSFLKN